MVSTHIATYLSDICNQPTDHGQSGMELGAGDAQFVRNGLRLPQDERNAVDRLVAHLILESFTWGKPDALALCLESALSSRPYASPASSNSSHSPDVGSLPPCRLASSTVASRIHAVCMR